jgi:hypothetical protein
MFEKAARMKLRFDYRGQISVEDLWDLPVEVLDKVYSGLRAGQKAFEEESLLKTVSQERSLVDLKIEIVKHIVETKLKETEARKNRAMAKMQKEKIASIIEKKKDEGLASMSVEELQKAMEELEV